MLRDDEAIVKRRAKSMTASEHDGSEGGAQPPLELVGISKSFGGVAALRNVDFTLERGEIPRADVAATLLAALHTPETIGKTFDVLTGSHDIKEVLQSL